MTVLPVEVLKPIELLFNALEMTGGQIEAEAAIFERRLMERVGLVAMKRLTEEQRKEVAELANQAGSGGDGKGGELVVKLEEFLTPNEFAKMIKKEGDDFFEEVLKEEYKEADEEQKAKLEGLFKKDSLR